VSTEGSYRAKQSHRSLDAEVQRLAAQARLGWPKEARTLTWFGLRDGMSVLELGSGPGFVTEVLLDLVPHSPLTCLEIDPVLIEKAKQYLGGKDGGRLHFVEGSIMDTGLPENSFDFAVARLIFQHLPDPVAAAAEVLRVLKPGGKLVILDIDDAIWGIADPVFPGLDMVLERYAQAQAAQGGNRYIGRHLCRVLEAAGFVNLDLEAVIDDSDVLGIEAFSPQVDPDRLLRLVKAGMMTGEELERLRGAREAFLASDRPHILMVMLLACGEKP
jgi:ubiquinone/menaquinone biosynthesis C-methylase UbiE